MKVSNVLGVLSAQLGWREDTPVEGIIAGQRDAPVKGIAACAMPSVDVLRRAIAAGSNVILCDGHPYYLYDPLWSSLPGTKEAITAMPQVAAKRSMIEDAGLAIIRVHSAWNATRPASAALSLSTALGLDQAVAERGQDFAICDVEPATVSTFARRIRTSGTRLLGDPGWSVSRIAVLPGIASPARLGAALRDPHVDLVVAGEVIEWEGGPYMLDAQSAGRRCALLLTGFADSLDPDAAALARWAKGAFPSAPVQAFHNNGDFIWSIKDTVA